MRMMMFLALLLAMASCGGLDNPPVDGAAEGPHGIPICLDEVPCGLENVQINEWCTAGERGPTAVNWCARKCGICTWLHGPITAACTRTAGESCVPSCDQCDDIR